MAGTANTSLTLTDLEGLTVEFPELAVQLEIVAELDSMYAESEQIQSSAESIVSESRELVLRRISLFAMNLCFACTTMIAICSTTDARLWRCRTPYYSRPSELRKVTGDN
jgi:hypothetical protein